MRSQRTFALYIKGTEFYRESFKSIPEKWTAAKVPAEARAEPKLQLQVHKLDTLI
jgi:hypothetical protein